MPIHFVVGDTLIGGLSRYEIAKELGEGGFGKTYKVKDSSGQDKVAKVRKNLDDYLSQSGMTRSAAEQNFKTCERTFEVEYGAYRKFNHPKIPKVDEIFDCQGYRVMIMQFIEGENRGDYVFGLRKGGGLITAPTVEESMEMAIEILEILEVVHAEGITHRDLKPDNFQRRPNGEHVLLDFGGAAILRPGQSKQTTGAAFTTAYAPPEVAERKKVSEPRGDIYALGIILIEEITGTGPAPLSTVDGGKIIIGTQNIDTPKLDLNTIRRNNQPIDHRLLQIIGKSIRFEPADRWQSAREMREALENWLHPAPLVAQMHISASANDFGQQQASQPSNPWPFVIENRGTGSLNVSLNSNNSAFTVQPSQANISPGGGTRQFAVTFSPSQAQAETGVITINSNDPLAPSWAINLQGEGTMPKIEIVPTSIDYGQVELGWKAERSLRVKNTGKAALEIIRISVPSFFKVNVQTPFALAGNGGEREITVECVPEATGSIKAPLLLETNIPRSQFVDVELVVQATAAQKPTLSFVTPSSAEQGATTTVTVYGQNFPLAEFLLIDFGPGISVVSVASKTVSSRTNVEVVVDVAKDAATTSRKVVVLNQLGGLAPAELTDAFTVTKAKVKPVVVSINPAQFYPGDVKAMTIIGSGFVKDIKYKTTKRMVGGGRAAQLVDVEDPETRQVLLPSISTDAPDATFDNVEWISPTSLKAKLSILLPATDPTGKSYPAGNYDIFVANPDGEQGIGQGTLAIQALPTDQVHCWHCKKFIPEYDEARPRTQFCPQCGRSQLRPVEFRV